MFSVRGKRVVLTGAAGAIGAAIARIFTQQGASLFLTDWHAERLDALCGELGPQAKGRAADLKSMDEMKAVATEALAFFDGRVDGLIHCGGKTWSQPLLDENDDAFDHLYTTNVRSFWVLTRALVPSMRTNGGGSIVVISSAHGHRAEGACTLYASTKTALMAMAVEMSGEFGADNIRVNSVSPGWIMDFIPQHHWVLFHIKPEHHDEILQKMVDIDYQFVLQTQTLPRIGRPVDIALACAYLCSEAARFVTGTDLLVDGGKLHMQPDSLAGHMKMGERHAARTAKCLAARALPRHYWIDERRPLWYTEA